MESHCLFSVCFSSLFLSRASLKNITQSKAEKETESIHATYFLPISEPQLKKIQAETPGSRRHSSTADENHHQRMARNKEGSPYVS